MLAVAKSRKAGMRLDHPALVEERQAAGLLQHALDHEHHVRAAGVVLVEDERDVVLQRPGQDAVLELGDLLALLQHDRVLADEVDARDVAVEVDAHAGPVEARRDLLDMGRLAGAVIARDHDAAVAREAGQDRERRLAVEQVVRVEVRHMLLGLARRPGPPGPNRCRRPGARTPSCPAGRSGSRMWRAWQPLVRIGSRGAKAPVVSHRSAGARQASSSLIGRACAAQFPSLHNAPARASVREAAAHPCLVFDGEVGRFSRARRFSGCRAP